MYCVNNDMGRLGKKHARGKEGVQWGNYVFHCAHLLYYPPVQMYAHMYVYTHTCMCVECVNIPYNFFRENTEYSGIQNNYDVHLY